MVVCHPLLQADGEGPYPHLLRRLLRHTEVRDPQLVGTIGLELPIDPIQWARRLAVADRGAHDLSPHDTPQSLTTHKSFDRAAGHRDTLPVQLPPDLIGAINLQVGLPDTLDLRDQCLIAFRSLAA